MPKRPAGQAARESKGRRCKTPSSPWPSCSSPPTAIPAPCSPICFVCRSAREPCSAPLARGRARRFSIATRWRRRRGQRSQRSSSGCLVSRRGSQRAEFGARMNHTDGRNLDPELLRELDDGSAHAVELELLAGLKVLEHRGLVVADGEARLQPPFERDRELDAEPLRHRRALGEHLSAAASTISGSVPSSPSVARVRALIGLNATLPTSFSQIWFRSRVVDRRLQPTGGEGRRDRPASFADSLPSGSPIVNLVPSTWRITPGSTISVEQ